jgi:hypothetical protein
MITKHWSGRFRRGSGRQGRDSGRRRALRDDRDVLFRLVYLGVTNALALLRLLPMNDRDKDAEILALRHQIMVLERHLHGDRPRFTPADRALARRPAAPAAPHCTEPPTATGSSRDRTALASRSDRPPTCPQFPPPASWTAPNDPVDPPSGPAPGPREHHLGIPQNPRRTPRAGREGRRVHHLGDPQRRRCRTGTRAHQQHLGGVPTVPRPRDHRCRLLRNHHPDRCTPLCLGRHRPRHPPDPDPRRHRPSHRRLGDPDRPQSGHGPRRHRLPGETPAPRQGRQIPGPVRHRPRRRRN